MKRILVLILITLCVSAFAQNDLRKKTESKPNNFTQQINKHNEEKNQKRFFSQTQDRVPFKEKPLTAPNKENENFIPFRGKRVPIEKKIDSSVHKISIHETSLNKSDNYTLKFSFTSTINPLEFSKNKIYVNDVLIEDLSNLKYNKIGTEVFLPIEKDVLTNNNNEVIILIEDVKGDKTKYNLGNSQVWAKDNHIKTRPKIISDLETRHRENLCPKF
ncbi:MAG: hypothetical protein GX220_00045 [Treponema sp.]|jgi:hypothetical protein|nr:hypothetical protein [Treponema sp.]